MGQLNFTDLSVQVPLWKILESSIGIAEGARLLQEIKPDLVLVMDRGYSGYGEVFDVALNQGIDTVTWNIGYKSNRLVVKRYHRGNERDHPLSPSI